MTVAPCASGGSFVSKRRKEVIVKDLRGLLSSERVPKRVTEKIKVENKAGRCWTDTVKFRYWKKIIPSQAIDQINMDIQLKGLLSDCRK